MKYAAIWMNTPFRVLLAAQFGVVVSLTALVGGSVIINKRQHLDQTRQQLIESRQYTEQLIQQLARLPTLSQLQQQLAARRLPDTTLSSDSIATLLAIPLNQSDARLISWQPSSTEVAEPFSPNWRLMLNTDYSGLMSFLKSFNALPAVPRISQLVIKKEINGLRVELSLSRPFQQGSSS
ncbi:hypothetical protein [Brenneria uluponensis]|uniref:hypothetical protein n=1 Tax=Brenneria uluponensis TaxID=3057057 RepID=UPI0028E744A6|nr:hypothetical protein [Brenneria ulupoensis]